jgi:hypothetical protein
MRTHPVALIRLRAEPGRAGVSIGERAEPRAKR